MKKTLVFTVTLASLNVLASPFSISEPITKWKKKEVKVCFATKLDWSQSRISRPQGLGPITKTDEGLPFTLEQKDLIKNIVTTNYTKTETGISFIGFDDCEKTPEADVYVFRMDHRATLYGKANIGQSSLYRKVDDKVVFYRLNNNLGKEYVLLNTFDDNQVTNPQATVTAANQKRKRKTTHDEQLQLTTLHEFGHIAGLRHEHARIEDAENDFNCQTTFKSPDKLKEKEAATTKAFGVYDPNSIMSYCFLRKVNQQIGTSFVLREQGDMPINLTDETLYTKTKVGTDVYKYEIKIGLSAMDKHTLRCLYAYGKAEFADKCHPDFSL